MSKKALLERLRESIDIEIDGVDRYPKGRPCVIVANHNRLMDIFYLPLAIPDDSVSLVSARLMYKNEIPRKEMIHSLLYPLPIEAHGGSTYVELCLEAASRMVQNGVSVNIFPEGAYVDDQSLIYRGRTGAARILFRARELGSRPFFVPVAIEVDSKSNDLDSYQITEGDKVRITILDPVDYEREYSETVGNNDFSHRYFNYHVVTDKAMVEISQALGKPYCEDYIELFPKGNVMFSDGSTMPVEVANQSENISRYKRDLDDEVMKLVRTLKDKKDAK